MECNQPISKIVIRRTMPSFSDKQMKLLMRLFFNDIDKRARRGNHFYCHSTDKGLYGQ